MIKPTVTALTAILALLLISPLVLRADEPVGAEAGVEVLARGPVHEAFAQPSALDPQPSPVIAQKPPDPLPEEPPDLKPTGEDLDWIPGYWYWDADKKDWIWVSGAWRVPPPERKWVPGHWALTADGWQWVPGFWAPANQQDLPYREPPPDSMDNGPNGPAPDDDSIYIPGIWVPTENRYVWRPGYWLGCRTGWIWHRACYSWTPAGYCFVDGYWDYPLESRGCLFAPVCFTQSLWTTPGWCFRPSCAVNCGGMLDCFFVGPAHCHYFFGDFYSPVCLRAGWQPWFAFGLRCHDPLFGYYRWFHAGNPNWYATLRTNYLARRNGDLPRPPVTFAQQNLAVAKAVPGNGIAPVAIPLLTPLAQISPKVMPLEPVTHTHLLNQQTAIKQFRDLSQQRGQLEKPLLNGENKSSTPPPVLQLPPPPKAPPSKTIIDLKPENPEQTRLGSGRPPGAPFLLNGTGTKVDPPKPPVITTPPAKIETKPIAPKEPAPVIQVPASPPPVIKPAPIQIEKPVIQPPPSNPPAPINAPPPPPIKTTPLIITQPPSSPPPKFTPPPVSMPKPSTPSPPPRIINTPPPSPPPRGGGSPHIAPRPTPGSGNKSKHK
jgi:hypothetical protein